MLTGEPFIPQNITVHLGAPDADAANVTVSFPDYVKNVASSEIYPTWPENALRANIYAITSFALNRIYTEWYRSRGYHFDITSSTQYDQKFIEGREVFENVGRLVDELFDDFIRREGSIEPLFAAFCNGTTVTCSGLSQWGTVDLARQGYIPYDILRYYYGDDINIVRNAEVRTNTPSYPGTPLSPGSSGNPVQIKQIQLNRISANYPAIPKIPAANGIYDVATEAAVRKFQEIFNLTPNGIIDKATWYRIAYIYTSVKRLAELDSEGISQGEFSLQYTEDLRPGMQSNQVRGLQYFLAVVGAYYASVQPIEITGFYDAQTESSVRSFQRVFGLPQTGIVDETTWNDLYRAYLGIVESVPVNVEGAPVLYPGTILREGMTSEYVRILQEYLSYIHETIPEIPMVSNTGYFGPVTRSAVLAFQRYAGIPETGVVGAATWDAIAGLYSDLRFGFNKRPYQSPGYTIK
ncbi:MAG: peptidoglycan-binding protein [Oscillospiraceae bacterium]|nr:peptidoglycan-binding protein [Oscillospiraceae bacterium]MBR4102020.1 peptidoglycan-binding protein [Oscillospiraceae bacterium]MBR6618533.1 peptidoglycan-binding protein [Oscillospiraceae bacterium]